MGWTRAQKRAAKKEFAQRTYPEVMLDIETMDTESTAQIVSIGAFRFRMGNREDMASILDESRSFYAVLDLDEQAVRGRSTSDATIKWWKLKSKEAREVFNEQGEPVGRALDRFIRFCDGCKRIWGNGNMFDNAVVRDICVQYGKDYPVFYSRDMDVRTLTWVWNFLTNWRGKGRPPEIDFEYTAHNALDDARKQVLQVQKMITEPELKGSIYNES